MDSDIRGRDVGRAVFLCVAAFLEGREVSEHAPNKNKINMTFPHEVIRARLDEIGYHDPGESKKALMDMGTIVVNLRLGKLMISRKAVDAKGNTGLFTYFKK